ncbi:hypothetical protein AS9A_2605 [Hoyosella subflava DQS3-9A1]|uniref:Uncharacterized protein n=1 Tax=Hoyosella subflava (strain DSM 45089 / JCM 17490 / NBRC 109087 / DQS3-9A1) TaxID=443218 RepID=F6EGJ9_HOYSD|nr:hypothetical protein AS9A_2605 [Hoyosella subflava DQS3-9A1]
MLLTLAHSLVVTGGVNFTTIPAAGRRLTITFDTMDGVCDVTC